nr:40S ribosomal protein S12, mitochondrial-like [Penaeus vannamei]
MALRTLGLALSRMSLAPALPRGVPAVRAPTLTPPPVQTRLPPAAARNASTTCGAVPSWRTFSSVAAGTTPSSPRLVAAAVPASAGSTLVAQRRAIIFVQLATSDLVNSDLALPPLAIAGKAAGDLGAHEGTKASLRQMHKTGPVKKKRKNKNPLVKKAFARGVVLKTLIKKPRKPNSANRKCVLVRLSTGREMVAYVPGEGHNLQEHNIVLVRPGRLQDVPGVKVKCIRGKYDLQHVIKRKK